VADLCLADFDWVAHKLRKKMPLGEEVTKQTLSKGTADMLKRFDEELQDCMLLEVANRLVYFRWLRNVDLGFLFLNFSGKS